MREMMGMLVIRVEMRGIGAGMLGMRWECSHRSENDE